LLYWYKSTNTDAAAAAAAAASMFGKLKLGVKGGGKGGEGGAGVVPARHRFPFIFDMVFDLLRLLQFLDEKGNASSKMPLFQVLNRALIAP
jgi:hypothetical protein